MNKNGTMGALNAARARKKNMILSRRAKVAEMMLAGETSPPKMAAVLKVCERTIKTDIQQTRKEWLQSSLQDYGDKVAREHEALLFVRREAIEAWKQSKQNKSTKTVTTGSEKRSETIKTEGQCGDSQYLDIVIKTSDRIAKLFGLNREVENDCQPSLHLHSHQHQVVVIEDANWYGNTAHSKAAAAIAASDPSVVEPIEIQGGSVRPAVGQNGNGTAHGDEGAR